jgi:hypothetical protein
MLTNSRHRAAKGLPMVRQACSRLASFLGTWMGISGRRWLVLFAWLVGALPIGRAQGPPFIWARADGEPNWDFGWAVVVDAMTNVPLDRDNNIYRAGGFVQTYRFDSTNVVSTGNQEIFLAKLSNAPAGLVALNIGIEGEGMVTRTPDKTFYAPGETVTLNALPARHRGGRIFRPIRDRAVR